MPEIHVLPKDIAELIAAGEVIERPASVLKELTENAIDAGAKRITAELKRGGVLYLRVTDDGCGIAPEQVRTAFLRHATSKIQTAEDLDSIFPLGFRGEALRFDLRGCKDGGADTAAGRRARRSLCHGGRRGGLV